MTKRKNFSNYPFIGKKKPLLFYVEWQDHCTLGKVSWSDLKTASDMTPVDCVSVGWVIAQDEERIVLVPHITQEGHSSGEFCILVNDIRYVKKLDEGDRKWYHNLTREKPNAVHSTRQARRVAKR